MPTANFTVQDYTAPSLDAVNFGAGEGVEEIEGALVFEYLVGGEPERTVALDGEVLFGTFSTAGGTTIDATGISAELGFEFDAAMDDFTLIQTATLVPTFEFGADDSAPSTSESVVTADADGEAVFNTYSVSGALSSRVLLGAEFLYEFLVDRQSVPSGVDLIDDGTSLIKKGRGIGRKYGHDKKLIRNPSDVNETKE